MDVIKIKNKKTYVKLDLGTFKRLTTDTWFELY